MATFSHEGTEALQNLADEVEQERKNAGHTPFDAQEGHVETDEESEVVDEGVDIPMGSVSQVHQRNSPTM